MSSVRTRARNAILGLFAADAASVGLHWVYDQDAIKTTIATKNGGVVEFVDASKESKWHKNAALGAFSPYGDTVKLSIESIVECKGLDGADTRKRIAEFFGAPKYDRYLDHPTKDIVAKNGAEPANDVQSGSLGRAAAIAVFTANKTDAEFDALILEAIQATHKDDTEASALPYAAAAAWIIRKVIKDGVSVSDAIASVDADYAKLSKAAIKDKASSAIERALAARENKTAEEFGKETGLNCKTSNSLPVSTRVLVDSQSTSYEAIVRKEILVGGDSSGRLQFSGAVAGAVYGVPDSWLNNVKEKDAVIALVDRLLEVSGL